jgi:hypothetical protein
LRFTGKAWFNFRFARFSNYLAASTKFQHQHFWGNSETGDRCYDF